MAIIFHLPHTYMSRRGATINVTVPSDVANGTVVTCTCGSSTLSATVGSSKQVSFKVFMGTWVIQCNGVTLTSIINEMKIYNVDFTIKIYAYMINKNDPDPMSRVIYPETVSIDGNNYLVENYNYNPIRNIGGSSGSDVTYGSWTGNEFFFPKPCMITYSGVVDYYLDPNDYTKKSDGTASDVADLNYDGNAMVLFPKAYVLRREETINGVSYETFILSPIKINNDFHAYAHKNAVDGTEGDMAQSIYECCTDSSNRARSISGQTITTNLAGATSNANLYNTSTTNSLIGRIVNNNVSGNLPAGQWFCTTWAQWCYFQDLTFLLTRSTDGQGAIGNGALGSAINTTGTTNSFGLFGGSTTANNVKVKCLGIEDLWANHQKWLVGAVIINNKHYIKMCVDGEDGTTPEKYTYSGDNGYDTGIASNTFGNNICPKEFSFTERGRIGTAGYASTSTYCCDSYIKSGSIAQSGNYYGENKQCGPTALRWDPFTTSNDARASFMSIVLPQQNS